MSTLTLSINPFYAARHQPSSNVVRTMEQRYAKLPLAPLNASPVPHLTSLYHFDEPGSYGRRDYPGNCGGSLVRDLLRYFQVRRTADPMSGSGTCFDVCQELGIYCWSSDLHQGVDACSPSALPRDTFDFCWLHPPYWRQKIYTDDPRDLSRTPTLDAFLNRYRQLITNCAGSLVRGGRLAILMGDYCDRDAGFVPLVLPHETACL